MLSACLSRRAGRSQVRALEGTSWVSLVTVLVAGLLLGPPSVTRAEDVLAKEEFPDRVMIRGGWNYVFNADTTFAFNGAAGLGTTVDFSRQLGGQREDNLWRIDSLYRFNPRHAIGFSYYDVKRKGSVGLNEEITIGDRTFAAGGTIQSELDIALYRFFYNYSFYHDEKVELGTSFGLYFADIGASFSSNLTCFGTPSCASGTGVQGAESANFVAPLPSIGFLVNYHVTPRLQLQTRFDWFYLETANFEGTMNEIYLGLDYRLFKHFSLGAAFNRFDVDLKSAPEGKNGWRIENDWNTLLFYGALYF